MNRENQIEIEEMAVVLTDGGCADCTECLYNDRFNCKPIYDAELLYNAGYRKQRTGEWVVISKRGLNSKRNRRINYETYTCAACGRSNGKYKANFCPNCGAKMTKGDNK